MGQAEAYPSSIEETKSRRMATAQDMPDGLLNPEIDIEPEPDVDEAIAEACLLLNLPKETQKMQNRLIREETVLAMTRTTESCK